MIGYVAESDEDEILLLKEFQSEEPRYPFVDGPDCAIEKVPVFESYESGPTAESDVDERSPSVDVATADT